MQEFTKPITWILAVALGIGGAFAVYKEKAKSSKTMLAS